jgi:ArsR family transcriptional regulator
MALDTTIQMARLAALGDETRLRILDLLRDGERCVCELTEALELGQSLLSFHLKTLKDAGLVTDRREGRWVYYTLAPKGIDDVCAFLADLVIHQKTTRKAGRCR